MDGTITLISVAGQVSEVPVDRLGGQQHGAIAKAVAEVTRSVPYEQFAAQLEEICQKVQSVAERLKVRMGEYEAEEITIGLAVSGEGSIGVATAGVEASIQVNLKRRKNANISAP